MNRHLFKFLAYECYLLGLISAGISAFLFFQMNQLSLALVQAAIGSGCVFAGMLFHGMFSRSVEQWEKEIKAELEQDRHTEFWQAFNSALRKELVDK